MGPQSQHRGWGYGLGLEVEDIDSILDDVLAMDSAPQKTKAEKDRLHRIKEQKKMEEAEDV